MLINNVNKVCCIRTFRRQTASVLSDIKSRHSFSLNAPWATFSSNTDERFILMCSSYGILQLKYKYCNTLHSNQVFIRTMCANKIVCIYVTSSVHIQMLFAPFFTYLLTQSTRFNVPMTTRLYNYCFVHAPPTRFHYRLTTHCLVTTL